MTDDAHGIGVVGGGRGSTFAHGVAVDVPLQMGTLSKAIGGYGGYLCASAAVIDLIHNRARTFVYSTGLPPATVAAAIAALDLIERDPAYAALPLAKARTFTRLLKLPEATSPIVPLVIGEAEAALKASQLLEAEGFLVIAIRPPTVAGRDGATAFHLLRRPSRSRDRAPCRHRAPAHRGALSRGRRLRHRRPAPMSARPSSRPRWSAICAAPAQRSTPSSRWSAASIRSPSQAATPASCSPRSDAT